MPGKQIPLFATQSDLWLLMKEFSSGSSLYFVVMGLFDQAQPTVVNNPENLLPFTDYLVFDSGLGIAVRQVPQRKGGTKYAFDPMENPQAIVLHCGGLLDSQRLIAGAVSTAAMDARSDALYAMFVKVIRRRFEKIKSYYVGPEAVEMLDSGVRLMSSTKSPEIYDLVR